MAAIAGILHNQSTAAQALTGTTAKAAATTTSSTSSSSSSAATISSNDFLTLLVTELENQDPTSNADPNEYVNQLVSVNSLEQLVSINSTLSTDLGSSSSTSSGTSSGTTTDATANAAKASLAGLTGNGTSSATDQATVASNAPSIGSAFQTAASKLAPGNLGVPDANPAAQTVAQALSGRRHIQ
jgi:flagellar basal-body rod modification protein FlgD